MKTLTQTTEQLGTESATAASRRRQRVGLGAELDVAARARMGNEKW